MTQTKLRQKLSLYFDKSELRTLCFDLGFEHENIKGETREEIARELVNYCQRRGKIKDLIALCNKERPDVDWPPLDLAIEKNIKNRHFADTKSLGVLIAIGMFAIIVIVWLQFFDKQATINFLAGSILTVLLLGILVKLGYEVYILLPPFPKGYVLITQTVIEANGEVRKEVIDEIALHRKHRKIIIWRPPNSPVHNIEKLIIRSQNSKDFQHDNEQIIHIKLFMEGLKDQFTLSANESTPINAYDIRYNI